MCGRFALITPGAILAEQFQLAETPELTPRYNIAPTQPVVAVRLTPQSGARELTLFCWGLIHSWAKDKKMSGRMINARAETAAEKPAFRAAFKRRRCLIPADGFYEWQKQNGQKQPMYIHARDGLPLALAGLWETWHAADGSVIDSCTILTTTPNELIAPIHNRMPVIVAPEDYTTWLDPTPDPELGRHLLRPYPTAQMTAYPVNTYVNSPPQRSTPLHRATGVNQTHLFGRCDSHEVDLQPDFFGDVGYAGDAGNLQIVIRPLHSDDAKTADFHLGNGRRRHHKSHRLRDVPNLQVAGQVKRDRLADNGRFLAQPLNRRWRKHDELIRVLG